MLAQKLMNAFLEHATSLSSSKDRTARFRAANYKRVADLLSVTFKPDYTVTSNDINSLNISDHMKIKANNIIMGKSIGKIKNNVKVTKVDVKDAKSKADTKTNVKDNTLLIKELTTFMGIGPEKALELIALGLTKINQLHMKKYKQLLSDETKLFLDLKPKPQIPNEHIKLIEPYLLKAQSANMRLRLVGSYRREKPISRDIDLMVISDQSNAIELLLKRLSKLLAGKIYPYSKGYDKLSMLIDVTDIINLDDGPIIYKIDAFRTTPDEEIPMLLYSTGSKEFNISMRSAAKRKGYLLNQKGLFLDGKIVPNLNTEEDYFKLLGLDYKEPKLRV